MSLVDEARTVRQRIAERLRELEPLVREYEELKRAAGEMGLDEAEVDARSTPSPRARSRRSPQTRPRKAKSSAAEIPAGSSADLGDRVLAAVQSDPGKSVADYARMLQQPPTALYRPVRELTNSGAIVKRARQLFPA